MQTKFSVIVPVYGVEKYIKQCVSSILAQSYNNYELILVDDGSPDGCPLICDEYAKKDMRIKVIHQKNGGSSDARNAGIKKITGEYILFLDGDDYWLKLDFLEKLNERINQLDSDVICLNYKKVYENGRGYNYFSLGKNMPSTCMGEASIRYVIENDIWTSAPWNKVIKKELFFKGDLTFIKGITSEDIDWCARLANLATTYDYLETPYIGYRQRESSVSKVMTYDKVCCLRNNIYKIKKIIDKVDGEKKELIIQYFSYQYGTLLKNIALLQSLNQRKEICMEVKHLQKLLRYSRNRKIKLLRFVVKFLGIGGTVEILHLIECLKQGKKEYEKKKNNSIYSDI